jgi:thiamine pyrophosphate-dependent acetolactate synthase large subunit-like protein
VLLEVLRSVCVRYIFGKPRTRELPLIGAVIDWPDIGYIWTLHEASAIEASVVASPMSLTRAFQG